MFGVVGVAYLERRRENLVGQTTKKEQQAKEEGAEIQQIKNFATETSVYKKLDTKPKAYAVNETAISNGLKFLQDWKEKQEAKEPTPERVALIQTLDQKIQIMQNSIS